ncbi:MAG TPA: hypothetical protein VEG60_07690 [Candidatus Binatia bacterium]|nr:hypothetical protein [Candidatus Binatia bacterium]
MSNKGSDTESRSILKDVDELIDSALGLKDIGKSPHHRHETSCRELTERPKTGLEVSALISKIYEKVGENWDKAKNHSKSEENWRFIPQPGINADNDSREVRLERAIVNIPKEIWTDAPNWVNQVPIASGLVDPNADRGRRIDLVHKCGDRAFEFIELKVDSDTPLYAAMEVLKYGVVYIFCRQDERASQHIDRTKELLKAERIHLRVLAPEKYYEKYNLSWLEKSISGGLAEFRRQRKFTFEMDFKFETLSLVISCCSPRWLMAV